MLQRIRYGLLAIVPIHVVGAKSFPQDAKELQRVMRYEEHVPANDGHLVIYR